VQSETNRTTINNIINDDLEKLIGRLKVLNKDENDNLFNGEKSLCNALKCNQGILHNM